MIIDFVSNNIHLRKKTFPGFNIDKALTIVATIADSTLSHVYNSGTHGS